MENVVWFEANENNDGIETLAMLEGRIVGYNGILKDEKVIYKDNQYTVVMVSRLGDFGLSETGELPYTLRVSPRYVIKQ
ncbi:TPA: hypothetical protein SUB30_004780 [Bacillus pseudomycoides]|nr:hypothetical protein [Bacillus pseudomycoides]